MRQIVLVQGPERVMARLRRHAHQAAELLHVLHTAKVTTKPNYSKIINNNLLSTIIYLFIYFIYNCKINNLTNIIKRKDLIVCIGIDSETTGPICKILSPLESYIIPG